MPAHPYIKIMLLQEILFGTFVPPETTNTVTHRIGFAFHNQYYKKPLAPRKKVNLKPKDEMPDSWKKILKIMKASKQYMSPSDVAPKTTWTRNHCNIVMAGLFKKGYLKRVKLKVGNTRTFRYIYEKG